MSRNQAFESVVV